MAWFRLLHGLHHMDKTKH